MTTLSRTSFSMSGGSCWLRCRGLLLHLGDHRVGARLGHRLAVDDGDVLGLGGQRDEPGAGDGGQNDAGGEKTLLHDGTGAFRALTG